jgi:hypothetical protein
LHAALSEGVHNLTDDECLIRAEDACIVLGELAERIESALKDDTTVKDALKRLLGQQKGN